MGSVAASSLFSVNPNASAFFIETDPRFTNYRSWLSSEWMINALGIDPGTIHKRLGDGYYEQKLIRDQIGQLTGRRFLDGYASDEEQYKALMSAGVTFATDYGLRPGIALTAEQMARLTSDIVWLVEEGVTLPDGSKVKALVPKVYVAVRNGDISQNGALLAADRIHLNLSGDATNSGDIAGRKVVSINAGTISNLRGANISANTVLLDAQKDIRNIGATIRASDAISLNALGSIDIRSTTATQSGSGPYSWSQTTLDRTAGLYVTNPSGLGVIAMNAGKDIHLIGATIRNAGSHGITQINAGGSVNMGTVDTGSSQRYEWNQDNFRANAQTSQVGTTIATANHLQINAGSNINATAATLSSDHGQIALNAGNNINLLEGRNTTDVSGSQTSQKSGLLSTTKTKTTWDSHSDTANGTTVSGDSVILNAGNDLTTRGANVVATNDVLLKAGNNIDIGAAKNTYTDHTTTSTSKSGLIGNSLTSVTVGSQKTTSERTVNETVHTGSSIGSLQGNVTLDAGNHYMQTGSTVSAPTGDVNISATSVDIVAAQDTRTETTTDTFKQKGITVAFSSPVTGAVEHAVNVARDVGKSSDARVNALSALNAGYSAYQAGQVLTADKFGASNQPVQKAGEEKPEARKGGNLGVSVTYGQQQSKATSTTTDVTHQGSAVYGNTVNITATGAGEQSRINVIGSDIDSKVSTTLKADGDIKLLSAQDTSTHTSQNSSQGWNAGVAVTFGNGNGASFGVTAGGNAGRGHADMDAVTQRNTTVGSQGTTTLSSGGTTTIKGAQVTGNQVVVNANDLKIESLQDTESFKSGQKNASAQVTVGYGFSASGNYAQSNIKSDYASVNTQSGILAGDGGYQVNVKNSTGLKAGIITSTQAAEDSNKNSLTTATLTATDIQNKANYDASGISVGGGIVQNGAGEKGDRIIMNPGSDAQGKASTGVSKSIGFGVDSGSQSSTTYSGVNTSNITITDATAQATTGRSFDQIKADVATSTTTDQVDANSGAIANSFDANKVQSEIDLQMRVIQEFDANRQAFRNDRNAQEAKLREDAESLKDTNPELANQKLLEADQMQRNTILFDSIASALGGPNSNGVVGTIANFAGPQLAYQIGQYFKGTDQEGSGAHILAHGILGAALAAATGGDAFSGAISGASAEAMAPVISKWLYGTANASELDVDQRSTIASIISLGNASLGLAFGQNSTDVIGISQIAKNAVENNWLTEREFVIWQKANETCSKGEQTACYVAKELHELDMVREVELKVFAQRAKSKLEATGDYTDDAYRRELAKYFDGVNQSKLFSTLSNAEKVALFRKLDVNNYSEVKTFTKWMADPAQDGETILNVVRLPVSLDTAQSRLSAAFIEFQAREVYMDNKVFPTEAAATKYFMVLMQPLATKYTFEIGALIVKTNRGYEIVNARVGTATDPATGEGYGVEPSLTSREGEKPVAKIHTHITETNFGTGVSPLSGNDAKHSEDIELPLTVTLPSGRIFTYDPKTGKVKETPKPPLLKPARKKRNGT